MDCYGSENKADFPAVEQLESYVKNMYIKISATDCLSINPWPKAFSARGCQMKKSYETCSHSKLRKNVCVCVCVCACVYV